MVAPFPPEKITGIVRVDLGARERYAIERINKRQISHKTSDLYSSSGQWGKDYMSYLLRDPVVKSHYLRCWIRSSGVSVLEEKKRSMSELSAQSQEPISQPKPSKAFSIAELSIACTNSALSQVPEKERAQAEEKIYKKYYGNEDSSAPGKSDLNYMIKKATMLRHDIMCDLAKSEVLAQIRAYYEYDLALMSTLPNDNKDQAEPGKIYLSSDGSYIFRDLNGVAQKGSLSLKDSKIDLRNLPEHLNDNNFKRQILEDISKAGHAFSHVFFKIPREFRELIEAFLISPLETRRGYDYYKNKYLEPLSDVIALISKNIGKEENPKALNQYETLLTHLKLAIEYSFFCDQDKAIDLLRSINILQNRISFVRDFLPAIKKNPIFDAKDKVTVIIKIQKEPEEIFDTKQKSFMQILHPFLCAPLSEKKGYDYYKNDSLTPLTNILSTIIEKILSSNDINKINQYEKLLSHLEIAIENSFLCNKEIDLLFSIKLLRNKVNFLKELESEGINVIKPPESSFLSFSNEKEILSFAQLKKDIMEKDQVLGIERYDLKDFKIEQQDKFKSILTKYQSKEEELIKKARVLKSEEKLVAKEVVIASEAKKVAKLSKSESLLKELLREPSELEHSDSLELTSQSSFSVASKSHEKLSNPDEVQSEEEEPPQGLPKRSGGKRLG